MSKSKDLINIYFGAHAPLQTHAKSSTSQKKTVKKTKANKEENIPRRDLEWQLKNKNWRLMSSEAEQRAKLGYFFYFIQIVEMLKDSIVITICR